MTAAEHARVDCVAEPLKGQGTNVRRMIDRFSLYATSVIGLCLVAGTALAQRDPPNYNDLPCNALCRAYMGSYYAPPEPEVSPEPLPEPEPEASVPAAPPRPPARQIVRAPRRTAALPPVRPSDLQPEAAGLDKIEVVLPPPVPDNPEISLNDHQVPLADAQISAASVINPDVRVVLPPEAGVPAFDLEPAASAQSGAIEAAPTRPAEE